MNAISLLLYAIILASFSSNATAKTPATPAPTTTAATTPTAANLSAQITPIKTNLTALKDTYFTDIQPASPEITAATTAITTTVAATGTDQAALIAVTNAMTVAMTVYAAEAQKMIQAKCTTASAAIDTLLDKNGTLVATIPAILQKISTAGAATKTELTNQQATLVATLTAAKKAIQALKSKSVVSSTPAAKTFAYATTIRTGITNLAAAIAPTIATNATSYSQQIDTLKTNATSAYLANPIVIQQAQAAATAATAEYTTANNRLQVTNISSACAITVQALSDKLDLGKQNTAINTACNNASYRDATNYLTTAKPLKAILAEEQAKLALLNTNITTAINTTPKTEALLTTVSGYVTEGQRIQTRLKTGINDLFSQSSLKLTSAMVTKLAALNTYLTTALATPPATNTPATPPTSTTPTTTSPTIEQTAANIRNTTGASTGSTTTTPSTTPPASNTPATNNNPSTATDIRNAPRTAEQSDPTRTSMGVASQQSTDVNGMTENTAVRRGAGA